MKSAAARRGVGDLGAFLHHKRHMHRDHGSGVEFLRVLIRVS
jgi:hypothetical protein